MRKIQKNIKMQTIYRPPNIHLQTAFKSVNNTIYTKSAFTDFKGENRLFFWFVNNTSETERNY